MNDNLQLKPNIIGYLGVDTGGTFTDFYYQQADNAVIHKVLSTPDAPEQAILQGIRELNLLELVRRGKIAIVHGSTVATNAALEGKGVRTAFVTNSGFADTLSLARQNREHIYALQPSQCEPPVAAELCFEVPCRRDFSGCVVTALKEQDIQSLVQQIANAKVDAVAISLLYSYVNSEEEQRLAAALPDTLFVATSAEVLPEYKEYERGIATWLNAWLGPKVEGYLAQLQAAVAPAPLGIMQSSGGTISAVQASRKAVNLLLSGPAGGLAAAKEIGRSLGKRRLLTLDMGGTSTDVALIDGDIRLTSDGRLGPYPVAVPMVDMHTIGAGGGSLAFVDCAGLLHVGPQSAGANPGPACYGQGGTQATVTDANALLGRLRPEYFLGGGMALDLAAAEAVITPLAVSLGVTTEQAAIGIVALANQHMVRALRVISVQKGYHPVEFELCCFGGAGGLHICALAQELGVKRILIPANSGVLSAYGMLLAPKQRQLSRTVNRLLDDVSESTVDEWILPLEQKGLSELLAEGVGSSVEVKVSFDCRYLGQSFTLNLGRPPKITQIEENFHAAHQASYGHRMNLPVEVVNVRVALVAPAAVNLRQARNRQVLKEAPWASVVLPELGDCRIVQRQHLAIEQIIEGPAIICEQVTTTLVGVGWKAHLDRAGNLLLLASEQRPNTANDVANEN